MTIGSVRPLERQRVITGLSSDVKPVDVEEGTQFIESDTGNKYEYRGQPAGWVLI